MCYCELVLVHSNSEEPLYCKSYRNSIDFYSTVIVEEILNLRKKKQIKYEKKYTNKLSFNLTKKTFLILHAKLPKLNGKKNTDMVVKIL